VAELCGDGNRVKMFESVVMSMRSQCNKHEAQFS
jgi:hypothetical protein